MGFRGKSRGAASGYAVESVRNDDLPQWPAVARRNREHVPAKRLVVSDLEQVERRLDDFGRSPAALARELIQLAERFRRQHDIEPAGRRISGGEVREGSHGRSFHTRYPPGVLGETPVTPEHRPPTAMLPRPGARPVRR